jgi:glutathione-independent formaldehyde dehydrogenase
VKAAAYKGQFDVAVEDVADRRIEGPLDAVIRITTANICGSDLHLYAGRALLDAGMVPGHENMDIVKETGAGVDRVSVSFNIACGTCRNCTAGWTCACLRADPSGQPTAGYGDP